MRDLGGQKGAPILREPVRPFDLRADREGAEEAVDRLARRRAGTRWPDRETGADQGPRLDRIRACATTGPATTTCGAARTSQRLRSFGSYRTVLDGIDVHSLHARPTPWRFPCCCATAGLGPSWSSVTWSVR